MRTGRSPLTLKVIGGIVWLTNNEKAQDKSFITAPELSKLLHAFAAEYVRQWQQRLKNTTPWHHHDISRMMTNARKLTDVFRDPFVAAEDGDEIYNLLTAEVMTEKVSKDILEWDEIGQRMLVKFATEHLAEGWLCVRDKITKKLKTFKT